MPSYFISAHGTLRKEGNRQTQAKFIVPQGATIYFFTDPGTLMQAEASDMAMDLLISPTFTFADELAIRELALEVYKEGDLCLNYTAHTDGCSFRDPTGVYIVGNSAGRQPVLPIPLGTSKTLQQLVCGMSGSSSQAMGNHFYWFACREHKVDHREQNQHMFKFFGAGSGTARTVVMPGHTKAVRLFNTSSRSASKADIYDAVADPVCQEAQYKRKVKLLLAHIKKNKSLY